MENSSDFLLRDGEPEGNLQEETRGISPPASGFSPVKSALRLPLAQHSGSWGPGAF